MEEYQSGKHDVQALPKSLQSSYSTDNESPEKKPAKAVPKVSTKKARKKPVSESTDPDFEIKKPKKKVEDKARSITPESFEMKMPKRFPSSILKKCDKEEAKQSFEKSSRNFDTILAPADAPDVFRGDSYDPDITAELMELVEKEMMKIQKKGFLHSLPVNVSILTIFDNYLLDWKWYDILKKSDLTWTELS